MFTQSYMGWFIHGYTDKPECHVQNPLTLNTVGTFKSLHAAKCAIAKYVRKGLVESEYRQAKKGA